MTLEPGASLLAQCKRLKDRYSANTDGYALMVEQLKDVPMPAAAQQDIDQYRASIKNHEGGHGDKYKFLYEEPEVLESNNKYEGFNFKVEKPIKFDLK